MHVYAYVYMYGSQSDVAPYAAMHNSTTRPLHEVHFCMRAHAHTQTHAHKHTFPRDSGNLPRCQFFCPT